MPLSNTDIAKIAHAINRAYCEALNDHSQVSWEEAPEWQKDSALNGVRFHINNPDMSPKNSHKNWLAEKVAAGWKYGPVKDASIKEHPCCVPYDELPESQKAKDFIFRQVVHSLKAL